MENDKRFDSGFALVITLLLVLILILMAAGVSYTGGANIELINAVSHKPQSINAGETCIDDAIEWLSTSAGSDWVNGSGAAYNLAASSSDPLYGQTILKDTIPTGATTDDRNSYFKNVLDKAGYTSCIVEKIGVASVRGVGIEVGTGSGTSGYTIKITGSGNFNIQTNPDGTKKNWQSNSSSSVIEAVIDYLP